MQTGAADDQERRWATAVPLPRRTGESTVLWAIWLTYGSFYFCRQNISAAVPGLEASGLTKTQIGLILGALKLTYAVGQLVNGQLAERFGARKLLAFGMFGSAALNLLFGWAEGLYFWIFIWACNGYCQALGWTPCMRVAANWIPVERRGRALGIIGTSYQVMAGVTFVIAGQAIHWLGWRAAFYVPALLLTAAGIHMLLVLRETPVASLNANEEDVRRDRAAVIAPAEPWQTRLLETLSNSRLWVLAISLGLLDACRYGYLDWGLAHLTEVQPGHIGTTAAKYAVLPAGGVLGALLGGWLTDRYFAGRRAPVIVGFLMTLFVLTLGYDAIALTSPTGTVVLLFFIGMAIFGAQVLLVGTAPADFARQGTAAAAAGFVNSMGYLGASIGDQATGALVHHYHWQMAIHFWAGCALLAALVAATLWNVGPRPASAELGD